ncbi:hypothetical protein [Streptomyces sp. MH13]|uniref:hypothetical protein n=1 Tax=unclassified Streptomyces TaxID=2593676 RepID=UPI003CE89C55
MTRTELGPAFVPAVVVPAGCRVVSRWPRPHGAPPVAEAGRFRGEPRQSFYRVEN